MHGFELLPAMSKKEETLATGLVDARRMFICLSCFQVDAWVAVTACTMTCWKTSANNPTVIAVLFLAGGKSMPESHAFMNQPRQFIPHYKPPSF